MKLFSAAAASLAIAAGGNTAAVLAALADGADEAENPLFVAAGLQAFNGATLDMLRSEGNDRDGIAVDTLGNLQQLGFLHGFNATSWDRLASEGNDRDAITAVALGLLQVGGYLHGFNGATWDRARMLGDTTLLGLGQLSMSPAVPGASAVKVKVRRTASDSSTRATVITPSSGKKIRVIGVAVMSDTSSVNNHEVYFGTGANILSDTSKAIYMTGVDVDSHIATSQPFPDGGGPIGAADEVLSHRTGGNITTGHHTIITYREE